MPEMSVAFILLGTGIFLVVIQINGLLIKRQKLLHFITIAFLFPQTLCSLLPLHCPEMMLNKPGCLLFILFTCFLYFSTVPFCITQNMKFRKLSHNAALCDVAPTVLAVMGIEKPAEITGQSLV